MSDIISLHVYVKTVTQYRLQRADSDTTTK